MHNTRRLARSIHRLAVEQIRAGATGLYNTHKQDTTMILIAYALAILSGGLVVFGSSMFDWDWLSPAYALLAIAGLLLSLLYTEYVFALMPLLVTIRSVSLLSIPSLESVSSADIRAAELAIALFSLLYILKVIFDPGKLCLTKETKALLLLGLWVVISWLWSPYPMRAILLGTRLLLCIASSFLCVNILTKKEDLFRIVFVWVAVAIMAAILALADYFFLERTIWMAIKTPTQFMTERQSLMFAHPQRLAVFLNFGFALTLGISRTVSRKKGVVLFLSLALIFFALLTTLSRAAFVALAAGTTILGLLSKREWRYLALIVLVLASLMLVRPDFAQVLFARLGSITDFEEKAVSARFILWNAALQIISGPQVLWGVGIATFSEAIALYFPSIKVFGTPHNVYLDMLVDLGLVGLTLYMYILGRLLTKMYSLYQRTSDWFSKQISLGMLVGLVIFVVDNVFHGEVLEIPGWLFMGLCMSMINIHRDVFD